jgi:polysaccharide biosynthesis protein PslH
MKVLMLTPYLPYPLFSGGQIRTYNLLKNLADKHEITLFSFIRQDKERIHLDKLARFCKKVKVFPRRPAWDKKNIFLAGFTPFPFVMIATYLSLTVRKAIKFELENYNYDLIHAEPFYMMPNIPKTKIPILLVEQTIEYMVYKKYVDDFSKAVLKPFMYFDVYKLKFWEKLYWQKATRLAAMSEEDKEIMQKVVKDKKIDVVANGVDIDFFSKTKIKRPKDPVVLFVGNFKWLPNKDAAVFLTKKIWPKIKKSVPNARLWIVGKNPTEKILALGKHQGVKVEGSIDDIRQALGSSTVMLAPIRNGRGTKYKVLESMAAKLPVVSTPLGIDGIKAKDGKEVLVADNADTLAKKTVKLLKNKALGKKLAANAFKLVSEKYNWNYVASCLDKVYKELGQFN